VRLLSKNDTSLAISLIIGAVIVFQQPLRGLLDVAQEVELRYHLDLIPALTVLTVVFIFHQYRKRQQASAEAMAAAAEARQATARSQELERLMTFGRALGNALDVPALQQVLWQYLPKFANDREVWLLTYQENHWQILLQDATVSRRRSADVFEALAARTCSLEALAHGHENGISTEDDVCFPMTVAGSTPVGVLGIRNIPELAPEERKALGAAAALTAIAVRNVQLLLASREHSMRDGLTGWFNRAYALEALEAELRRAKRVRAPVSVVMFDVDHFKLVNDREGHLAGDALLSGVSRHLAQALRSTDIKCRYGGDEFLIILPDTPTLGAQQVAECLRKEIAAVDAASNRAVPITASLGVATAAPGELNPTTLVAQADAALYEAKRLGRNRVAVAPAPASMLPSESREPQESYP
jgi:diguanylate cyclase (GGDEF)-like protein